MPLSLGFAQPLGNEWITFGQPYLKLSITQTGLYCLTGADLKRVGISTQNLKPATLQLFRRGREQALYVPNQLGLGFADTDTLLFWGEGNDGVCDSVLYRPPARQPHPYVSLFSDTAAYFLTWNADAAGKRMTTPNPQTPTRPLPYIRQTDRRLFTESYPAGAIYPMGANAATGTVLTAYDTGEGWTSRPLSGSSCLEQAFRLSNRLPGTPVTLSGLLVGRSPTDHQTDVWAGASWQSVQRVGNVQFSHYNTQPFSVTLPSADSLYVRVCPILANETQSVSYLTLRFAQQPVFQPKTSTTFRVSGIVPQSVVVPNGYGLFDITDTDNVQRIAVRTDAGQSIATLPPAPTEHTYFVTQTAKPVPKLTPVRFRVLDKTQATYLIVTHRRLYQAARTYAAYRASEAGGHFDTLTVTIDELFDQFSYGDRHPWAIRRLAQAVLAQNPNRLPYLFLIGQSRDPQGVRFMPDAASVDMVPNAGWPGSDVALVEGLNGEPRYVPAMAVGRLNANEPQQVLDYLEKVKLHESPMPSALAQKSVWHLSGGISDWEKRLIGDFMSQSARQLTESFRGAYVQTKYHQTAYPTERFPIPDVLQRGLALLTIFGHSSLDITDIDPGFVSDNSLGYTSQTRFPMLLVNGCALGNFYFGRPTLGQDWLLTPKRGAVLVLAHTHNGFMGPLMQYTRIFYELLADSARIGQSVAMLQRETIRRILQTDTSAVAIANTQQMTLQGDPAVGIFAAQKPDYTFQSVPQGSRYQADSVRVAAVLVNWGIGVRQPIAVRVRHMSAGGSILTEKRFTVSAPFLSDTLYWQMPIPDGQPDSTWVEWTADADQHISELSETNNVLRQPLTRPADAFRLQIGPNPFSTQLSVQAFLGDVPYWTDARLQLFDLHGRQVRELRPQGAEWTWDGRDEAGALLPAGLYVYRLAGLPRAAHAHPMTGRLLFRP